MSIIVNLTGSPSAGKSTLALYLTSVFKQHGVKAEYASEFIKDAIFEDNQSVIKDQLFVLANQNKSLSRLSNVDLVITDSPLFSSSIYSLYNKTSPYTLGSFHKLTLELFNMYSNVTLFVDRRKDIQYSSSGRIHTPEQLDEIDEMIHKYLDQNNIPYLSTGEKRYDEIPLMIIEYIASNSQKLGLVTNELIMYSQLYTQFYNESETEKFKDHLLDEHIQKIKEEQEKRKEKND